MPRRGYRSLTIPESLYLQLKDYVEHSNGRYVSVAEVVRKAVWDFLKSNELARGIKEGCLENGE